MARLHIPHIKTILIVVASLVLVGGISAGTFVLLRQLKPAVLGSLRKGGQSDSTTTQQVTGPDADRLRAEQLLQAGKLADAKAAYQSAASGYADAGNVAAAADATRQITIIDAMQKSQTTARQQPYVPHQSGSTK